jgi:hypothetical protein
VITGEEERKSHMIERGISEILITEDSGRAESEFFHNQEELGCLLIRTKMKKRNRLRLYFQRTVALTDRAYIIY